MSNNTDYKKPHPEVYDLLPNVYRSEVNKAVSRNVFERFLTKSELINVVGTISDDPNDPIRLPENDIHRQNFQLQPLLYSKIATVDHISSFKDLIRELQRLGVNYDRMDEWLSADQFNFTPPIDIDKINNYYNYFWLDDSEPQYITIKNRTKQLQIIISQAFSDNTSLENLVQLYYNETNPTQKQIYADQVESIYPGFIMIYEEYVYLQSNVTSNLVNINGWDGIVDGLTIVEIDAGNNAFIVEGNYATIINSLPIIVPNLFPSINVNNGPNAGVYSLNVAAYYNAGLNRTIIEVIQPIPSTSNLTGLIDAGTYDAPIDGLNIIAVGTNEFTIQDDYTSVFENLNSFGVVGGPNATPLPNPSPNDLWVIDSVTYNEITNETTIFTVEPLLDSVTVAGLINAGRYDYLLANNTQIPNSFGFSTQNDPWSSSNKWTHIADIPSGTNISSTYRAEQPIIEYEPFIELNQWSRVQYQWKYSNNGETNYSIVEQQPSDDEVLLANFTNEINNVLTTTTFEIYATEINPKLTQGIAITIEYDDGVAYSYHTITDIIYDLGNSKATITVDVVLNSGFTTANVQPIRYTSLGDDWVGFTNHWLYVKSFVPTPCDNQLVSSVYDEDSIDYDTTRFQEINAAGASVNWYQLDQMTILDHDDVRVYARGERIYGAYALGYFNGVSFEYSSTNRNALWLFEPVLSGTIRVEVGPSAEVDEMKRSIQVKLSPEDISTTTISLVQFIKTEQVKTKAQQYPLFNMFNMDGSSVYKASPLWMFQESVDYPVNELIHRRIVVDGTVYTFQQLLLERDNGRMYAYKQNDDLKTVWRTDEKNRNYIPSYIDTNYQPVAIGDPSGDWELPKQMTCNLEHENRVSLTTTDLLRHFNTIIESQDSPPGFTGGLQDRWRLLSTPQYGAGGTIKEFSLGFDTFVSSLFVNNVTMLRLIDFAKQEYLNSIRRIRTILTDNYVELLSTTNPTELSNIHKHISDLVIDMYQSDDFFERVYGDTTCYDKTTGLGVRNWIATLPRFGMVSPIAPKLVVDYNMGFAQLTHHDGHLSQPILQHDTINKLSQALRNNTSTTSGLLINRPDVQNTLLGMIYYASDENVFYKCAVSAYGILAPSSLPEGTFWYDTNINELHQKQGSVFVIVDRDMCWIPMDFNITYASVLFEIERRLFAVCQDQPITYNIHDVQTDVDYDNNEQIQFAKYIAEQQIADPMASNYTASNAFSWNYSAVDINDFLVLSQPSQWLVQPPSTWYNIYESVYGTRYPNLEPWVLQGYNDKPLWWDTEYHTSNSRRWSTVMWTNIINALVPAGYLYPNGQISSYNTIEGTTTGGLVEYQVIPVNITNTQTSDGVYQPDELIPPYYASVNPIDAPIIATGVILPTLPNQSSAAEPYVFGQNGFTEDVWRTSIEYPYALTRISFITQPMQFTYFTFGNILDEIDGLQVDIKNNIIPSHRDTLFHGDMIGNTMYYFNGINQWYVNFLRFSSKNLNSSDFRDLWISWKPTLSYQMSSFIDARSMDLRNDSFEFDSSDYNLRTKKTPGFEDYFIESLSVVVNEIGSSELKRGVRVPSGQGEDWKFRINTANPQHTPIKIYRVDTNGTPTTFNILNGSVNNDTWNHFPINRNDVLTFIPGTIIDSLGSDYEGIQGIINFVDGYVAFLEDQGFVFNDSNYNNIDTTYSRIDNWQLQLELMVQQIYIGMVADTLPINFVGKWGFAIVNNTTDVFTASIANAFNFNDGDEIQFHSTNKLPEPLQEHVLYSMINVNNSLRTFQVAALGSTTPIDIESIGRGTLTFGLYRIETAIPQSFFELNPFKYVVVYDNDVGIIADIQHGSFEDITSEQGIYDQYGRPINNKNLRVFRGDLRSTIKMFQSIPDDITPDSQLHIGGMHLFLDGYEHAIMFNNVSINGALLFDEFLGSQITKVNMNVRTNYSKNYRPNIGGRYLSDDEQLPNIEASVNEIRYMYDTYLADEDSELVKAGRELLGFETQEYFNDLGITPKSQFLFYRGMIQQKGTFNAIKAFINLKLFIDANIDDYWAYKINDFGDAREREFPRLNLLPSDTENNMLLLRFVTDKDNSPLRDYRDVQMSDSSRWYNQPTQLKEIFDSVPNQHFEAEVTDFASLNGDEIAIGSHSAVSYKNNIISSNNGFIRLPVKCDAVTIVALQTNRNYHFTAQMDGPFSNSLTEHIVPNASSLTVYVSRGGEPFHLLPSTEVIEEDDGLNFIIQRYVDTVGQLSEIEVGDEFQIHIGNATLVKDTHFTRLNSQSVYFDTSDQVQDMSTISSLTFYCHNPAESKLNPAKLIDTETNVMLENISIWHPSQGHHYHNANVIIDQQSSDPAYYTNSPISGDINRNLAWLDRNVGNVWWNNDVLSYKPYQDNILYSSFNQRLKLWGQLQDWSQVELYEWVKSSVEPSLYEEYVKEQQDAGVSLAGIPRGSYFKRNRDVGGSEIFDLPWIELKDQIFNDILVNIDGFVFPVDISIVDDGTVFEIYENGVLIHEGTVIGGQVDISPYAFNYNSFITIRIPSYQPSDDELKFDPDVEDDGDINTQYKYDYKYVREDRVSANGFDTDSTYYFWVRHTATNHYGMSLQTAEQQLTKNPQSYMIFDNMLKSEQYTTSTQSLVTLPNRYTRCAVRGLVNKVSSVDRYIMQFTRNFVLRDDIGDVFQEPFLRNKHSQWKMFRQRQKFNIDRVLWNKLTEAVSGRSLDDSTQSVPSLDYVLYDEQYSTNTRFGLASGQSFIDSQRGIEIVVSEINNPDYDLYPIERAVFLQQYTFDTPDNIEIAMSAIYETFLPEHVNRIWFAVLFEALAGNTKFRDLFKTSWVQLDGVRLLDTSGVLQ